jgi:hypothetical protein
VDVWSRTDSGLAQPWFAFPITAADLAGGRASPHKRSLDLVGSLDALPITGSGQAR